MCHHRDREAEDKGGGGCGGGRGGSGSGGGHHLGSVWRGGAGSLHRAGRSQDLGLELQQLAHEAEIGRDDTATLPHKLKGLLEAHPLPLHQVGQADGG